MTLAELKALLGIPDEDTSQDAMLQLYLEAALEQAVTYCNRFDWSQDPLVLPASITLGIVRFVRIKQDLDGRSVGVQSESIGGMSQSFNTDASQQDLFADVWDLWSGYHKRKSVFRAARYAHTQGGGV